MMLANVYVYVYRQVQKHVHKFPSFILTLQRVRKTLVISLSSIWEKCLLIYRCINIIVYNCHICNNSCLIHITDIPCYLYNILRDAMFLYIVRSEHIHIIRISDLYLPAFIIINGFIPHISPQINSTILTHICTGKCIYTITYICTYNKAHKSKNMRNNTTEVYFSSVWRIYGKRCNSKSHKYNNNGSYLYIFSLSPYLSYCFIELLFSIFSHLYTDHIFANRIHKNLSYNQYIGYALS